MAQFSMTLTVLFYYNNFILQAYKQYILYLTLQLRFRKMTESNYEKTIDLTTTVGPSEDKVLVKTK